MRSNSTGPVVNASLASKCFLALAGSCTIVVGMISSPFSARCAPANFTSHVSDLNLRSESGFLLHHSVRNGLKRIVIGFYRRRTKFRGQSPLFFDSGHVGPDFTRQEICLQL